MARPPGGWHTSIQCAAQQTLVQFHDTTTRIRHAAAWATQQRLRQRRAHAVVRAAAGSSGGRVAALSVQIGQRAEEETRREHRSRRPLLRTAGKVSTRHRASRKGPW